VSHPAFADAAEDSLADKCWPLNCEHEHRNTPIRTRH
jgi:hypothetical protein